MPPLRGKPLGLAHERPAWTDNAKILLTGAVTMFQRDVTRSNPLQAQSIRCVLTGIAKKPRRRACSSQAAPGQRFQLRLWSCAVRSAQSCQVASAASFASCVVWSGRVPRPGGPEVPFVIQARLIGGPRCIIP